MELSRIFIHEVSESYSTPPLSEHVVMGTFLIASWGLFTWNNFCGNKCKVRGIQEVSPKWGRSICFGATFRFFSNYSRYINGRGIIRFLEENWDLKLTCNHYFFNSYICFISLRPPQKQPSLWRVFYLLEKLRTSLGNIFLYVVEQDTTNFFQFLLRVTYIFHQKSPKEGGKILTF